MTKQERPHGRGLEGRLFRWFLAMALGPALAVVVLAAWLWTGWLEGVGTLGAWQPVAESGRGVFEAAEPAAAQDSALAAALARHRDELSASLTLAGRWAYVGERLAAAAPLLALAFALLLGMLALAASRRLARELARPIRDLVGWAERLSREEPLPPGSPAEAREPAEVRVLRDALRRAAAERAAARERALEAERVRVWGELARRVAHEMKNPLTPLRLAGHRLAGSAASDPTLAEPVAVIREETERLEELAAHFAALGRPADEPVSPVDLHELLASLLATDLPADIESELVVESGAPVLVEGRYQVLVRAFRNLIRNATDAVAGGPSGSEKRIRVRLGPAPSSRAGEWVEVVVADTGPGLPPGAGDRIFAPDFTTKSKGTGLGLTMVRQSVLAHGGEVEARPAPGGGAEFVVRLPVGGTQAAGAAAGAVGDRSRRTPG